LKDILISISKPFSFRWSTVQSLANSLWKCWWDPETGVWRV